MARDLDALNTIRAGIEDQDLLEGSVRAYVQFAFEALNGTRFRCTQYDSGGNRRSEAFELIALTSQRNRLLHGAHCDAI